MIRTEAECLRQSLKQQHEQLAAASASLLNSRVQHHFMPHRMLLQHEGITLRVFEPSGPTTQRPLVLCYALVNRPWILDLMPDSSLIRQLTEQGLRVYLIDWGSPCRSQRYQGLEHYIGQLMHRCIQAAMDDSGSNSVDLAGVCQGGVFSLCYAALHPEQIHRLVTLVTPVDFHAHDFTLSHLYRGINIKQLVSAYGNVPGALVTQVFSNMQPMRLGQLKHLHTAKRLSEVPASQAQFLLMEQWLNDCPDLAGRALEQFVELFFQQNSLLQGEFEAGPMQVDLSRIEAPVLNIFGTEDHLVPPSAASALEGLCNRSGYQALPIKAGHIGTLMGSKALKQVPAAIHEWLQAKA
ncbi:alpha/beta fold hydrolase [Marinobacterium sp. AK62]|uniref:Alpha/beta fold hydrolase n=1 Tax=Marinobacterium alkalitolerans TaxID=1542925 RepID=A0ABS3ZBE4_9GAMM|nr:alpha/beta fold hydrolase [Marinobacterium alkalitolerans]MBP0049025.1 alpha/beta fold hydrolase [Marinobacterium alkalitolerans]